MPAEEPAERTGLAPGFAGRVRMYAMLIGYVGCFKVPRFAINTLVPFIVEEMGLPTALTPTLLAAFHPGYICSQIPGAAMVKRHSAKFLGTCQLAGCAAMLALMPRASGVRSQGAAVAVLSVFMALLGVLQGPMSPVMSQLNRNWMPAGVERAIAFRVTGLAHTAAPLLGALITTRLGARFGWRTVCYVYAGAVAAFTLVWATLASDRPLPKHAPRATPPPSPGPSAKTPTRPSVKPATDWQLLLTKPSLALAAFHICFNFLDSTRHQLSPSIYMQKCAEHRRLGIRPRASLGQPGSAWACLPVF